MKGVLIKQNEVKIVEFRDKLEDYYKLLGVDIIDIISATIDNKSFEIVCDDEGLLKNNPIPRAITNGRISLFGNLLICKYKGGGRLKGLNDEEIKSVIKNIDVYCINTKNDLIVTNCLKINEG